MRTAEQGIGAKSTEIGDMPAAGTSVETYNYRAFDSPWSRPSWRPG
jgi:hypothetical protein